MRHVIHHQILSDGAYWFWTGEKWTSKLDRAEIYRTRRLAVREGRGTPISFNQALVQEMMDS